MSHSAIVMLQLYIQINLKSINLNSFTWGTNNSIFKLAPYLSLDYKAKKLLSVSSKDYKKGCLSYICIVSLKVVGLWRKKALG